MDTARFTAYRDKVLHNVGKVIIGKECTFSAFVIAAVRNALEQLEEEQE